MPIHEARRARRRRARRRRRLVLAGTAAEPVLVSAGPDAILAQRGAVVVASLPADGLGGTRQELVERTSVPLLFVRGGLRPGGLAPERTLTRFSWSLRDAS